MKITIDTAKIERRLFSPQKKAEVNAKIIEFMNPFVPRESGTLMDSARPVTDGIEYDTPYAKRMYYGKGFDFSKEENKLATAQWDRAMIRAKGEALTREIGRIIKK